MWLDPHLLVAGRCGHGSRLAPAEAAQPADYIRFFAVSRDHAVPLASCRQAGAAVPSADDWVVGSVTELTRRPAP